MRFLVWPAAASRAAIALMQSDRDRCDISVPTHFHTTSHRLGVTHIPLLRSCPPAAGQHHDAPMNLAVARTAARYGAATANYTEVVHLVERAEPQTGLVGLRRVGGWGGGAVGLDRVSDECATYGVGCDRR